jgi:hypothetical protein
MIIPLPRFSPSLSLAMPCAGHGGENLMPDRLSTGIATRGDQRLSLRPGSMQD